MDKYSWQRQHKDLINNFLHFLNKKSDDYVLKGGTALMTCYNLNRFSEDIDLDAKATNLENIINNFCLINNLTYRVAKDTNTVKRFFIHYNHFNKPLKIEASYRTKDFFEHQITKINDIKVYRIDSLCLMKANAYFYRDKLRDLFDLSFIVNNYYDELSENTKFSVKNSLYYKGIEQFDYLIKQEKDELIDEGLLIDSFLKMIDKFGMLLNEDEKEIVNNLNFDISKDNGMEM